MGAGCSSGGCGTQLTGCVSMPCATAKKAPYLYQHGWGKCSAVATGKWKPRKIPKDQLQSGWIQMPNSRPVYVAIPNFGASTTRRYRMLGNIKHYAVRKLNPISGIVDQFSGSYWEVPEYLTDPITTLTAQAVFPMKYAISYFIPSKNVVVFYEDNGTKFSIRFDQLMKIDDCDILIAINALATDYPGLLDQRLSYRPVTAPQFTYTEDQNAIVAGPNATLLIPSPKLDATYNALTASGAIPPTNGQAAVQRAAFSRAAQTVSDFGDDDIEAEDFEESSATQIGDYIESKGDAHCFCHVIDLSKMSEHKNIDERIRADEAAESYSEITRCVNDIGALVEGNSEHASEITIRSESSIGSHLDGYQDKWIGTSAEAEYVYGDQYMSRKDVC